MLVKSCYGECVAVA